jgi:hypothetical protein
MAFASEIRAGAAFVELKSKDAGFVRGMRQAERRLESIGAVGRRVGATLIAVAGGVGGAIAALSIKAASDANESMNRFLQVFGSQADQAGAFAEGLAERVGRSAIDIRDSLASLQSFFVGLGFDPEEARKMSQQLSELAIDFASFNNISDEEAVSRFLSALSGSSEVLDKFGINTKQAALQQELLRLGINKAWTEVTESEKAMARLSIIARTMGAQGSIGDAARTSDGFANQLKRLQANLRDVRVEIGNALLPVATALLQRLNPITKRVAEFIKNNQGLVLVAGALTAGVVALGAVIFGLGLAAAVGSVALTGLLGLISAGGTIVGIAGSAIAALAGPIGIALAAVVGLGAGIFALSEDARNIAGVMLEVFKSLGAGVVATFGSIVNAITKGDLALAVKIAGTGMKVAWFSILDSMADYWYEFQKRIAKGFVDLGFFGGDEATRNAIKADIDGAYDDRRSRLSDELERLTDELRRLREQDPNFEGTTLGDFVSSLQNLGNLGGVGRGGSISSSGTFLGGALSSLARPVEDEIRKNTANTSKNTKKIADAIGSGTGGLYFT